MSSDLSPISWNDSYSVGVATLDEHHRQLARLINQLAECITESLRSEKMGDILTALINYAKYHFQHEEDLMAEAAYADLDRHRMEHQKFCEVMAETCYGVTLGLIGSKDLFTYLTQWWRHHILVEDMKYKPDLSALSQGIPT